MLQICNTAVFRRVNCIIIIGNQNAFSLNIKLRFDNIYLMFFSNLFRFRVSVYVKAAFEVLQMNKQDAEKITTEYLKPVYGFALKRCRNLQDAEDLSQDIILKIFTALLKREDIVDVQKYVWTVAHNCLANYYRDNGKSAEILSPEELSGQITDNTDIENGFIFKTEIIKLRAEIAYLSKVQREIVIAYYFENK